MTPIVQTAPAKINLNLHIVGRRDDGYHQLESRVGFTASGDLLSFAPSDDLKLSVRGPFRTDLTSDEDWSKNNLVSQAAALLKSAAGIDKGAHITLTKNLPVASGMGGGSSDAAATLRGLMTLWDVTIPLKTQLELAARLGADVPACLLPNSYVLREIGNHLTVVDRLGSTPIVLVNPGKAVLTKTVFDAFQAADTAFSPARDTPASYAALASDFGNDLTPFAVEQVPEIADILTELSGLDGVQLARMTGSGATCFAIFDSADTQRAGAAHIAATWPDYWVKADQLLA